MRGKINNRDRAKQIIDFSGLLYGNITPTDIDGIIEYQDKGYIIMETKLHDTEVLYGQKLAFERMNDDFIKSGKFSICIISEHNVTDTDKDIDMATTLVREYRWNGKWLQPKSKCTTKQIIDWFINNLSWKGKR